MVPDNSTNQSFNACTFAFRPSTNICIIFPHHSFALVTRSLKMRGIAVAYTLNTSFIDVHPDSTSLLICSHTTLRFVFIWSQFFQTYIHAATRAVIARIAIPIGHDIAQIARPASFTVVMIAVMIGSTIRRLAQRAVMAPVARIIFFASSGFASAHFNTSCAIQRTLSLSSLIIGMTAVATSLLTSSSDFSSCIWLPIAVCVASVAKPL